MTKTKAIINYWCNSFADKQSYNYNHKYNLIFKYNQSYNYNYWASPMFQYKYNLIFEYNKMTDSLITGNTTSLILYELRKIDETLSKTKEEHTLNFRMINPTEKFNFSEPILNTTKLGLIGLSVYNSVFNANRRNNQFLYEGNISEAVSPILAVTPGAYELTEIAQLIKE